MRQPAALPSNHHHQAPPDQLASPSITQPSSHAIIFASLAFSAHNPQPQRELRNRLLAQEQLLSKCFLIVCMEGELGTALAPVMKPSFSCPGCPNPPFPPFPAPVALEIQNFQNVPSLSFFWVMSSLVPPRRRESGNLISTTHATSFSSSHTPSVM